jgi:hypothetical protein
VYGSTLKAYASGVAAQPGRLAIDFLGDSHELTRATTALDPLVLRSPEAGAITLTAEGWSGEGLPIYVLSGIDFGFLESGSF